MKTSSLILLKYLFVSTLISFATNSYAQKKVYKYGGKCYPTAEAACNVWKDEGAVYDKDNPYSYRFPNATVITGDDSTYCGCRTTGTNGNGETVTYQQVQLISIEYDAAEPVRPVVKEASELFPSDTIGNRGTRTFGQATHRSGLNSFFETGTNGKAIRVVSDLSEKYLNKGTKPTDAGRKFIKTLGEKDDDAGHIIANRLGGSGGANVDNLFPQLPNINQGAFNQWEKQVATYVKDTTKVVSIEILFYYDQNSSRANKITYNYTVNGKVLSKDFDN